jgi:hypothetical protein
MTPSHTIIYHTTIASTELNRAATLKKRHSELPANYQGMWIASGLIQNQASTR